MTAYVALLRGINLGTRQMPMARLRKLAEGLGLEDARTYVASGNLLFRSDDRPADVEAKLEKAIAGEFGFPVDVIVRSASDWHGYAKTNPFLRESEATPNFVMMCVGKRPASDADLEEMRTRAAEHERIERVGNVLWLYFGKGVGLSKLPLSPRKDVWTTRNSRTVMKLDEMLSEMAD